MDRREDVRNDGQTPGLSVWDPGSKSTLLSRDLKIARLGFNLSSAEFQAHYLYQ